MHTDQNLDQLIAEIQKLTQAVEKLSAPHQVSLDVLDEAIAFRWDKENNAPGQFFAVKKPQLISFQDLCNVDTQLNKVKDNTEAFVKGYFANNILLTGARGTGKSSIIKACLASFHQQGLRVIELEKKYLDDLPRIVNLLQDRPERFIIFCDDLTFEAGDTSYSGLKTVLDGSLASSSANTLIYATSNRKHMVTEYSKDNSEIHVDDEGELHPGDTIEQKVSLADRFGLQLHFYSFNQNQYLDTVAFWLQSYGWNKEEIAGIRLLAIQYATQKGNRSGRVANQFAKMMAGQKLLKAEKN
ncbi:ATP-binding protein [Acinetobacter puyangensis]|uniref:ATP-binding protein n=1 Tax=Acinetobacter puyangensis TaxID=1096779 RepID=UPI003A4D256B